MADATPRKQIERQEITDFVGGLIQKLEDGDELTEGDKTALIEAYQRYFDTPFKDSIPVSYGEIWDKNLNRERNIKNLTELIDPTAHGRQIVCLLIQGLWPSRQEELSV